MCDKQRRTKNIDRSYFLVIFSSLFKAIPKILQIGNGGVGQELEQIIVQALGPGPVDDHVRYGEHLEQQAHALVLIARGAEQALRVKDERVGERVVRAPHAHRARLLLVGGHEDAATVEERVVQRVRLAVARVAKDGHALDQLVLGHLGIGRELRRRI